MRKELLDMIEVLANEKNVSKEIVRTALESAMAGAAKKSIQFEGMDPDIVAEIDPATGDYKIMRRWLVVPDSQGIQEPDKEILEWEAREDYADQGDLHAGDYVYEEVKDVNITGRRFAMDAKQVIMQKLREAERAQILEEFLAGNKDRKIVTGQIKAMVKGDAIVEIGRLEARLPKTEMIGNGRSLRIGDRIRAYILSLDEGKGPQKIILSRKCTEFLEELMKLEVPEIDQGFMEIKGCVREPGKRAKVAVLAKDKRIDPIGTCVGVKGARIRAIMDELNNEKIDIVKWSDQDAEYVVNSLAPAVVTSVVLHEDDKKAEVVAKDLKDAIGMDGNNARLASELTGWDIQVMSEQEADEKQLEQDQARIEEFMKWLNVDEDVARLLLEYGIETIEDLAFGPEDEIMSIEELDQDTIRDLRKTAQSASISMALEREEALKSVAQEIRDLPSMDSDLAFKLWKKEIRTLDDLADLSTDELMELAEIGQDQAQKVITEARAHWDQN